MCVQIAANCRQISAVQTFVEMNRFYIVGCLLVSLLFVFSLDRFVDCSLSPPHKVHGFCCTLVENSLAYGTQSRTEDVSSLRTVTTEVPALLSAAEVMITQSHKRTQDLEGQKKMSMQRSSDLQLLGAASGGVMGVKKRGAPPKPPAAPEKEEVVCRLEQYVPGLYKNVGILRSFWRKFSLVFKQSYRDNN